MGQNTERVTLLPVVLAANGRAKPDYVYVDSIEERHTKGAYSIEWRERGTTTPSFRRQERRGSIGPAAPQGSRIERTEPRVAVADKY